MGYISRYLKVFRACGKVDGPHRTNEKWKWWDAFVGWEHYRFWQSDDSKIARERWAVPSSPHLKPFWTSVSKTSLFWDIADSAGRPFELTSVISGWFKLRSWEKVALVLVSRHGGATIIDCPIAVRLWGDYLEDTTIRNYLIDYLLDLSEPFRSWYKP